MNANYYAQFVSVSIGDRSVVLSLPFGFCSKYKDAKTGQKTVLVTPSSGSVVPSGIYLEDDRHYTEDDRHYKFTRSTISYQCF